MIFFRRGIQTYSYDPLDRLLSTRTPNEPIQRFYNRDRLATERHGTQSYSLLECQQHLLAEKRVVRQTLETSLLGTDLARSVLHCVNPSFTQALVYSPYGHHPVQNGRNSLLGFNGERPDPLTGHYLIGNGHRAYNPVLMRFNSPDKLSPFGQGGLNAYAYCMGDPVNRADPSGQFSTALLPAIVSFFGALLGTQPNMGFLSAVSKLWSGRRSFQAVASVANTSGTILASGLTLTRLAMNEAAPNIYTNTMLNIATAASAAAVITGAFGKAFYRMKNGPFIFEKSLEEVTAVPKNPAATSSNLTPTVPANVSNPLPQKSSPTMEGNVHDQKAIQGNSQRAGDIRRNL